MKKKKKRHCERIKQQDRDNILGRHVGRDNGHMRTKQMVEHRME